MRPLWKDLLAAVWLGMVLPGMVLNIFVLKERNSQQEPSRVIQMEPVQTEKQSVMLRQQGGLSEDIDLDTYLTGVLLAEIPADFHPEALKAQAVAARTYTMKAHTTGGKHGDGSICTDSACCQGYISEELYLSGGGTTEHLEKMRMAVQVTSDFVLLYEGELIEATYFSASNGRTESAQAVWGADFPYLQTVSSPEALSETTVSYTPEEFQSLLGSTTTENLADWFGPVNYTEGGGVADMEICGMRYTGVELRSLLGLRSTAFQIQPDGENITIRTMGYGHRVGMSQYGADCMARSGNTWQKILQHYYPGTNLVQYSDVS